MDRKNDLAGLLVKVSGDLVDQRSQQLLTRAHSHAGGLPRRLKIFRDPREIGRGRRGVGSHRRVQPQLAILNAAKAASQLFSSVAAIKRLSGSQAA